MSVFPDTTQTVVTIIRTKYRTTDYWKEVRKCGLMWRLKLDTEEQETKLDGSEFQSGITSTKKRGFKWIGFSQRNEKCCAVVETGGSVKVLLIYGFLPIYKHTLDLCELLQYVKKACPLPKGTYEGSRSHKIPMDIPSVSWPKSAGREIKTIQKILVATCSN